MVVIWEDYVKIECCVGFKVCIVMLIVWFVGGVL